MDPKKWIKQLEKTSPAASSTTDSHWTSGRYGRFKKVGRNYHVEVKHEGVVYVKKVRARWRALFDIDNGLEK